MAVKLDHEIVQPDINSFAVAGNPIQHSKSPQIHTLFAKQCAQPLHYSKLLVPVDQFAAYADAFFVAGGKGLNVTVPFKVEAFHYAADLTDRARAAKAVNTLFQHPNSTICGDNTDGNGLIHDLRDCLGWPLRDKRILILGAGGAVRGVLMPLLQNQPRLLVVANRTEAKAQALADTFAEYGSINGCSLADLRSQQFDLVINGTSTGLNDEMPTLPDTLFSGADSCAYDMVYGDAPTPFLRWARNLGVTNRSDGLGMLVGQAAESFYVWHGVKPDIGPVLNQLRNSTL